MSLKLQGAKSLTILDPASVATNATATSLTVDTQGYDELQIVLTRATHATGAMTALTIQQSDTDVASNYANVTGYVAGTDFTLASMTGGTNAASAKPAGVFNIDLRGKKRYFRLGAVTPSGADGIVGATATLTRASVTPSSNGASVTVNPS